jgi:hypothetical protein
MKSPSEFIFFLVVACLMYMVLGTILWIFDDPALFFKNLDGKNIYTLIIIILRYFCALALLIVIIGYIIYLKRHPERKNRKYIS